MTACERITNVVGSWPGVPAGAGRRGAFASMGGGR